MINPNQVLTVGVFEELLTKALIASEQRVEERILKQVDAMIDAKLLVFEVRLTKKILDHVDAKIDAKIDALRAEMMERFDDIDYTFKIVFQHLAYLAETIDAHYSEFTQYKKLTH